MTYRPRGRRCSDIMARVAERVRFPSTTGPTLAGLVDLPRGRGARDGASSPTASRSARTAPAASRICKQLASEGIGMLRFDNLGLGDSEGDWSDGSFSHKVADTVRAVEFMNSLGPRGAAARRALLRGLGRDRRAPTSARRWRRWPASARRTNPPTSSTTTTPWCERIEADGEAPFLIGGKALTLKRHFIEDVRAADLRERIRTLRRALLVMHSPTDNTVGIANASEIFRAARHPRSFVSLEGADHLLTGKNQAARAARIISAWADPYL